MRGMGARGVLGAQLGTKSLAAPCRHPLPSHLATPSLGPQLWKQRSQEARAAQRFLGSQVGPGAPGGLPRLQASTFSMT